MIHSRVPSLIPPVLHPLAVHFPIVLIPLAAVLMTFVAWKRPQWGRSLVLVLLAAVAVSSIVAAQLGARDLAKAYDSMNQEARNVAQTHQLLGTATQLFSIALLAVAYFARKKLFDSNGAWGLVVALWVLFVIVTITALYGGSLVFEQGVNTP